MSSALHAPDPRILSPGEVNFLWWFIQGSIMGVETRHALWRAWGLCARHAAAWLTAEAAFRNCRFHGPAIVYTELMRMALRALAPSGRLAGARARRALRARDGCLVCGAGLGPASPGFVPGNRLETGRDGTRLSRFLRATEPFWRPSVCGRCARTRAAPRCRVHLLEDLAADPLLALQPHRDLVAVTARALARYERAFGWEQRGTDTPAERASLVVAVGWCAGWPALLGMH